MNLFEDLVEELKEDNLLEETSIDAVPKSESKELSSDIESLESVVESVLIDVVKDDSISVNAAVFAEGAAKDDDVVVVETENLEVFENAQLIEAKVENEVSAVIPSEFDEYDLEAKAGDIELSKSGVENTQPLIGVENTDSSRGEVAESLGDLSSDGAELEVPEDEEFYRRRALDEVNGLEMVEHVISGVEREQLKTIPGQFDVSSVKAALAEFLQVADDVQSDEHIKAEFTLVRETQDWHSSLSGRDKVITVGHLRRYCETAKPSLSSQALISLARFYRNAPFTEDVRAKYDLIITKLFTEEIGGKKRKLRFDANELIQHIAELYADWSSVPLYSTEDDSELLLAAIKFQDFMQEAEAAASFDDLIKMDFFKKLTAFKERTSENFFSPLLASAAIECNVAVGNRFIELLREEKSEGKSLTEKYGFLHDKSISEATSKTLQLIDLLSDKKVKSANKEDKNTGNDIEEKPETGKKNGLFTANKILLGVTAITIILAVYYFFVLD